MLEDFALTDILEEPLAAFVTRLAREGRDPKPLVGVEFIDVNPFRLVSGEGPTNVDEARSVANPEAVVCIDFDLAADGDRAAFMCQPFGKGSDEFADEHRDDREHQSGCQNRGADPGRRQPRGAHHREFGTR